MPNPWEMDWSKSQAAQSAGEPAPTPKPWDMDWSKASAAPASKSVVDAYKSGGVKAAASQIADNTKAAWNYNPSDEQKMEAAKHPVTGMEDPAYQYGVGFLSPTNPVKGLASMLKSGKAKVSAFLSSEEGLHPVIEAVESAAPVADGAKKLNLNLNALKMNEPLFQGASGAGEAAATAGPEMRQVIDPFTKVRKMVPVEGAATQAAPVESLGKESFLPEFSKASATGAAVGGFVAHKLGLPVEAGVYAGAKAAPYAVKAYMKTSQGLIPILEHSGQELGALTRAGIAASELKK